MPKKVKKVPAIVLDIDDTIVSFTSFLCYLYNSKNHTSIAEADLTTWNFLDTKVIDAQGKIIEGATLRQFFQDYEDSGLYAALPPIKESVLAMTLMKKLGYKIILMTARRPEFAKDTEINFLSHNIPYDEIFFGADKVKEIKKLAKTHTLVAFADDKFDYVNAIEDTDLVGTCFLVTRSHNKAVQDLKDIKRITDLLEMVRYLPDVTKEG